MNVEKLNEAIEVMGIENIVVVDKNFAINLVETLTWMLKDIDFRNEDVGMEREDTKHVALARVLLKELQDGIV